MGFTKKDLNAILLFIALLFLLIGCSKRINENNSDGNEMTASVIEDSKENCRFANESDCRPIEIRKGEAENEEMNNTQEAASAGRISNNTINLSEEVLLSNCEEGWKCVEKNYRAYQYINCSWISIEHCIYGCNNGTCSPPPICKLNSLKCTNDNVVKCEDGYGWALNESCDYECQDGVCIGKNETIQINTTNLNNTTNSNNATNTTTQNNFISDNCMSVSKYNLTGNNATDEYFTLKNSCTYSIDMTGLTASDNVANHIFTFSNFNLVSNNEVTVVTGRGTNSTTTLYWGRGSAVWNDPGDTLYLNTSNGTSILIKSLTP